MKSFLILFLSLLLCTFTTDSEAAESAESLVFAALSHLDKDLDEAEETIVRALELYPDNPEVHFTCGRIMGRQAENAFLSALSYAEKSLTCLKQAVALAPNEYRYRVGLLNFYLGVPSIAGGDIKLARKQVEEIYQISALEGSKAEIKYLRSTKQTAVLKQRLLEMLDIFPADAEINLRLGLLLQEEGQYEKAFSAFKAATKSDDHSTHYLNALYQLGRNAVFSGLHIQEGIDGLLTYVKQFDKAKSIPPAEWAFLRLAQLHHLMKEQALEEHYSKLASKSEDRELHRALKKLRKSRG